MSIWFWSHCDFILMQFCLIYCQALGLATQAGRWSARFRTWMFTLSLLVIRVIKMYPSGARRSSTKDCWGMHQKQFTYRSDFKGLCVGSCTCGWCCLWMPTVTYDLNKSTWWCHDLPNIRRLLRLYVKYIFLQIPYRNYHPPGICLLW